MSIAWEELIKLYDKLVDDGKPVCPVAHTYLTAHVGVLIDKNGNFLAAMKTQAQGELVAVPCTIESEGRTNNIAPHLLSDQRQLKLLQGLREYKHCFKIPGLLRGIFIAYPL